MPLISSNPWLIRLTNELGLYVDVGDVSADISTAVWAIGFYRDPAVHYEMLSGESQFPSSYFFANFSSPQDVVHLLH